MNGIDKLTERIAADSGKESRELRSRAEAQAAEIASGYEALAQSDYDEALEDARKAAAERVERLGSVAELEARQMHLAARQEMLGRAFDRAREKLLSLPDADYEKLLVKLALEGSSTGSEALIFSVKDRPRFGKKVVQAANAALEAAGKNAGLTLSEEAREFEGGLYVQDGLVENNCTFDTILRILREQMAREVADILFD